MSNPVDVSEIRCEVLRPYVRQYLPETYCGRRVISFLQEPGVFGASSIKTPKLRKYTLVNGIINQCEIHSDGHPGPYWAVLDAMSDLQYFNKEEVVQKAVDTLVDYEGRFKGNAHKGCLSAFYILKTHMTHPARKKMGFGFIVEGLDKDADKEYMIRERRAHETSAFAPENDEVFATIVVGKR